MLHLPDGGIVAPELTELDRKLKQGDGIHFTGDPRLYIQIGVLTDRVTRREGRRIEVWRLNEDGSNSMVGHWLPAEQHRIIYDLAGMRADAPGHVSTVDRIDAHNRAKEEADSQAAVEQMFETLDHAVRIHHEQNNPRQKFYMGGRADRGARA